MAFARDTYTATASQTDFTITFSYLAAADVTVYVDGTLKTVGSGNDYTLPNSTTVRFNSGVAEDATVVLERVTSQSARLVNWTAGALTESDMDNDSLQAFYMAQEAIDKAALALGVDTDDLFTAATKRIKNLGTPTASTDAVTKAYVDALTILSGNVPTPDNPGDDGFALTASGGTFDWAATGITSVAADTTPQLGGDLDVNGKDIVSVSNADVDIVPHGTGSVNLQDKPLKRAKIIDYGETVNAIGAIGGGTQDIDLELGNVVSGTVDTSTTTFTFSNPSATGIACSFTLTLTNGGSQTVNWPASVDWPGGTAPTLTTSGVDVLTFFTLDAGTIWYGFSAGIGMA